MKMKQLLSLLAHRKQKNDLRLPPISIQKTPLEPKGCERQTSPFEGLTDQRASSRVTISIYRHYTPNTASRQTEKLFDASRKLEYNPPTLSNRFLNKTVSATTSKELP